MKSILTIIEGYLRKYPNPSSISMIDDCLLKLTYSLSTPYTNSKSNREVFLPIGNIANDGRKMSTISSSLSYN